MKFVATFAFIFLLIHAANSYAVQVEDWGNLPPYMTQAVIDMVVTHVRDMGFDCNSATHLDSFGGNGSLEAEQGAGFILSCDLGSKRYEITHEGNQIWRIENL